MAPGARARARARGGQQVFPTHLQWLACACAMWTGQGRAGRAIRPYRTNHKYGPCAPSGRSPTLCMHRRSVRQLTSETKASWPTALLSAEAAAAAGAGACPADGFGEAGGRPLGQLPGAGSGGGPPGGSGAGAYDHGSDANELEELVARCVCAYACVRGRECVLCVRARACMHASVYTCLPACVCLRARTHAHTLG